MKQLPETNANYVFKRNGFTLTAIKYPNRKRWALVVEDVERGQSVLWTLAYFRSEEAARQFKAIMGGINTSEEAE